MTGRQTIAVAGVTLALGLSAQSQSKPDYPIKPVAFTAVHLNDDFWAPRFEINRTASIPSAFEQCELTGRVQLFERAAAVLRGEANVDKRPPGYPFDETDLYLMDLPRGTSPVAVAKDLPASFEGEVAHGRLFLRTNLDAPTYRVYSVDPERPEREHWREIVAPRPDAVLEGVRVSARHLALSYVERASSRLAVSGARRCAVACQYKDNTHNTRNSQPWLLLTSRFRSCPNRSPKRPCSTGRRSRAKPLPRTRS